MNRQNFIIGALKRIGAAGHKAQLQKPAADDAVTSEFLYVPCTRPRYHGRSAEARCWVREVPIVKKTTKRIYYTSDTWNRHEAVVSPGCISREQFEADTRCHREDRCRHGYPAGVIPIPGGRHRAEPAGWLFYATREAAEGALRRAERERAGRAARGVSFVAAREMALIRELRRAMAAAHPDHGGTADQFIQARRRYQTALRQAPA